MEKVNPGYPLTIKASDWNRLVDMARQPRPPANNPQSAMQLSISVVSVENQTETPIPVYGIVEITGMVIQPVADDRTIHTPVYAGVAPSMSTRGRATYAIATDAIDPGEVGRCIVSGITPIQTTDGVVVTTRGYIEPLFNGGFFGTSVNHITPLSIVGYPSNSAYNRAVYTTCISTVQVSYPVPVIVQSGASAGVYNVAMYHDGYDAPSTGFALMALPSGTYGEVVPVGTRLTGWQIPSYCTFGTMEDA